MNSFLANKRCVHSFDLSVCSELLQTESLNTMQSCRTEKRPSTEPESASDSWFSSLCLSVLILALGSNRWLEVWCKWGKGQMFVVTVLRRVSWSCLCCCSAPKPHKKGNSDREIQSCLGASHAEEKHTCIRHRTSCFSTFPSYYEPLFNSVVDAAAVSNWLVKEVHALDLRPIDRHSWWYTDAMPFVNFLLRRLFSRRLCRMDKDGSDPVTRKITPISLLQHLLEKRGSDEAHCDCVSCFFWSMPFSFGPHSFSSITTMRTWTKWTLITSLKIARLFLSLSPLLFRLFCDYSGMILSKSSAAPLIFCQMSSFRVVSQSSLNGWMVPYDSFHEGYMREDTLWEAVAACDELDEWTKIYFHYGFNIVFVPWSMARCFPDFLSFSDPFSLFTPLTFKATINPVQPDGQALYVHQMAQVILPSSSNCEDAISSEQHCLFLNSSQSHAICLASTESHLFVSSHSIMLCCFLCYGSAQAVKTLMSDFLDAMVTLFFLLLFLLSVSDTFLTADRTWIAVEHLTTCQSICHSSWWRTFQLALLSCAARTVSHQLNRRRLTPSNREGEGAAIANWLGRCACISLFRQGKQSSFVFAWLVQFFLSVSFLLLCSILIDFFVYVGLGLCFPGKRDQDGERSFAKWTPSCVWFSHTMLISAYPHVGEINSLDCGRNSGMHRQKEFAVDYSVCYQASDSIWVWLVRGASIVGRQQTLAEQKETNCTDHQCNVPSFFRTRMDNVRHRGTK